MTLTVDRPPRTAMEVFKILPEGTLCEVIENQLYMPPAPDDSHQDASVALTMAIGNFVTQNKLGFVRHAPYDVYLNESNVFQPDFIFVSNENASGRQMDGFHGAPDLVIEIISPGSEKYDRVVKKNIYERSGVIEYWIINPETKECSGFESVNGKFLPLPVALRQIESKLLHSTFHF